MKTSKIFLLILAVVVVGYLAVKIGTGGKSADWNSYTYQGNVNFSFNYPSDWNEPQETGLEDRKRVIFGEGLVIETGNFYSQELEKNLTAEEAAENDIAVNPGESEKETIQVAETGAQKISFTVPAGFLGTKDGNPIPPEPQSITDIFLQKSSSSPIIFMRYSKADGEIFDRLLDSFRFE